MAVKTIDMVKVTPVDSNGQGKGMERLVPLSEVNAGAVAAVPEATPSVEGTVKQAANVAASAVPYADLTAAANHVNSILTALKNAGIMVPDA